MVARSLCQHSPGLISVRSQVILDFYLAFLSANYTANVANLLLHYTLMHIM